MDASLDSGGSGNRCKTCGVALSATMHQQHICFSITEPSSTLEWAAAYCLGGLGAVHQYVTMLGYQLATKDHPDIMALYSDDEVRQLVAGVIWNDFPSANDADGARYMRETLVPIADGYAPYLKDARFRWQPSRETRWALAFVYKHMPAMLEGVFGVSDDARRAAERMLEVRAAQERTHFHFMLARAGEPMDDVRTRAAATARDWYRRALLEQNVFVLGHIVHMVEDSYSAAHTRRVPPDGDLTEIYYFGAQTDRSHSSLESYDAVMRPGGEPAERVQWCVRAVRHILLRFVADRVDLHKAFPHGRPDSSASAETAQEYLRLSDGAVDSFYNMLLRVTFRRATK